MATVFTMPLYLKFLLSDTQKAVRANCFGFLGNSKVKSSLTKSP